MSTARDVVVAFSVEGDEESFDAAGRQQRLRRQEQRQQLRRMVDTSCAKLTALALR